jgi:hypothetical protein
MPFLAINNYEIPISVRNSPEYENEIIGDKFGSYSGMIISSIQGYRRRWRIRTTPMELADAHGLRNLIAGKGHNWKFDNSLYSGKDSLGIFSRNSTRYLTDGTEIATETPGYESGPHENDDINYVDDALWIEVGTTPVTGSNTFLDTDGGGGIANGYTAYATGTGAGTRSIDAVTTTFGRPGCQKIVKNDGGGDRFGIRSTSLLTGVTNPNRCKFMVNITALNPGGYVILQADYYSAADAYLQTKAIYLNSTTSGFETYELDASTNANAAKAYLYAFIDDADGTVYVQAIQSENKSITTSWADGARDDEAVAFDASIFDRNDFTIGFWFKPTVTQTIADSYRSLFHCYIDSDNYWQMVVGPDGIPYFAVKGRGSEVNTYDSGDSALSKDTWYFLVAHGDRSSFSMTVNGVLTDKGDIHLGYRIPYGTPDYLYLGSDANGVSQPCGLYSDLLVLPYRISTSQLLAYYNSSRSFYNLPRLEMHGDYLKRDQNNPIIAEGTFNSMTAVQQARGISYVLDFDLVEIIEP